MIALPDRLRPTLRIETIVLLVVAYLVALANAPWWTAATVGRTWTHAGDWLFVAACAVALVALHFALLAPLASRWTVRPLLSLIVIASFAAGFYIRTYAVIIDPTMMQNLLKTDTGEARDLVSWSLVASVLLGSALPLAFLWTVRIRERPWPRALGFRCASVALALLLAVAAILLVSRDFTSLMRNQRELRYLVTPANLVYGLVASAFKDIRDVHAVRAPVGRDAHRVRTEAGGKPRVFVLVIGETARAANFSLLGYARPTTPELARLPITAFSDVSSCGTSTEVSLPCIFSQQGRADYDEKRIRGSEGLLDVLAHAGYDVRWLDNQSGCKGVCAGVTYRKLGPELDAAQCDGKECRDGILVRALAGELAGIRSDTVIVLHMMGNHGPAYFKRYPPEFRRFVPDCATAELRNCSRDEVVNAYDNAILYTDHVLAQLIGELDAHAAAFDGALLYVSDHGESLGENGLYLHGLPYAFAPRTQTHVPMITWVSDSFAATRGVDTRCVAAKHGATLSHDNVFHSVLGVLDVATTAYQPGLDVFDGCRVARRPAS